MRTKFEFQMAKSFVHEAEKRLHTGSLWVEYQPSSRRANDLPRYFLIPCDPIPTIYKKQDDG